MAEEVQAEIIEPKKSIEVSYTPAVITDNIAALDAWVDEQIEPYVGNVVDPDNAEMIKRARKDMADLNNIKKPIEEERKRIKRAYEAPLKEFEGRVKSITSKIDDARAAIKAQVDEADARFKQNRRALLADEYAGCAGAIADVIPFSAILEDAWLNRSTTEAKAINELYDKAENALKGYRTLQEKELAHKDEVVKHYADTLDIIAALELEDKLNEKARKMAEFKAKQKAAEAVKEERTAPEQKQPAAPTTEAQAIYLWSLDMKFEGTQEFAEQVAATLKGMGITGSAIKRLAVIEDD